MKDLLIYTAFSEIRVDFRKNWNGVGDWELIVKAQDLKACRVMDALKLTVSQTKALGNEKINSISSSLYNKK